MHAADLFVKCLEAEGVTHVFGVPGEENLHFLDALRRSSIKTVVTRHESGAGFMAATVGRLTGKASVALSTLGPGATNLVTPAAYAQLGGIPLMLITGQKPIHKSKQGAFQIIDTVDLMRPVTKSTKQIVHGANIPALVRDAFRQAEEERPGAVHLELPEDVAAEDVEGVSFPIHKIRRPVPEEKAIDEAVRRIEAAKRPLLLIGAGANRKRTAKMLRLLVDKLGIPFFNTQMGKGVIDERHPLYIGTAALSANDYVHCAVEAADLIINVGHDVVEKPPFMMKHGGQEVIHVNFYSAKVDAIYFPQCEVIGDIGNAIWQFTEKITPQAHWDFAPFMRAAASLRGHIAEQTSSDASFPVRPQTLVQKVRDAVPEHGIVCLDNGMYKIWFAREYQAYAPNTLLLDNALATMGAGLPSAIAASIVNPSTVVVCVTGDGGFMMCAQELETAVRLGVNVTIILLNDNGYGMIKWKQAGMQLPSFGLDFGNPDFVAFAQSFGAKGIRITSIDHLENTLKSTIGTPGVHVIEVPMNYDDNDAVLNKALKTLTCDV